MKFIQVHLHKSNISVKAGISLTTRGGNNMLFISKIAKGGLFEQAVNSCAKVGMRVLRINGVSVDGMDAASAACLIKGATGDIPFLLFEASNPMELMAVESNRINSATVAKTAEGKVKVSFAGARGDVRVTQIAEDSPFKNTSLTVGDTLLAANGISLTGLDMRQIKDTIGQVTCPITLIFGSFVINSAPTGSTSPVPFRSQAATIPKPPRYRAVIY